MTPLCDEHVPLRFCEHEKLPSLHFAVGWPHEGHWLLGTWAPLQVRMVGVGVGCGVGVGAGVGVAVGAGVGVGAGAGVAATGWGWFG